MGILVAREGYLPIGASVDESEELQAQIEAARSLSTPLNFSGIEDLRGIVAGALSLYSDSALCSEEDLVLCPPPA
jgi:hypothetical protein